MGMNGLHLTRIALPRLILCAALAAGWVRLGAATIPVRFPEGAMHGFLVLRTQDGQFVAQGELLETPKDAENHKVMVFRFDDGSVLQETTVFTQNGVYELRSYRLEQRGPAFGEDTDIYLERATGKYRVEIKPHRGGAAKVLEGRLDLPPDVYNGMLLTVLKDLPKGTHETVHLVAFTPEPRIIQLEMSPAGERAVRVGKVQMSAVHFVLKPRLGPWLRVFATLLGRAPPDSNVWMMSGDVPAFVGFEGQLYTTGPVLRIELVSPRAL
jgi:hypothetical protein